MPGAVEKTIALIKPDAVRAGKAREILQCIERDGFTVVQQRELQLGRASASAFYAEHKEKPFFEKLVAFMTSGPIVALILAREDAIRRWRQLMGPTNSLVAKQDAPNRQALEYNTGLLESGFSIRGRFGTDGTFNAVHGSDAFRSARREIQFFFPEAAVDIPSLCGGELDAFLETSQTELAQKLDAVLLRGLTVLAKEKPTGNSYEALKFLGRWLIENNPNKPKKNNTIDDGTLPDLALDDETLALLDQLSEDANKKK